MKKLIFPFVLCPLLASAAWSKELTDEEVFVEANILTIFYHELGHAVIDLMNVPIFGQEEDAADVMAVLLVDWIYEEETAQALAYNGAFGYISDPEGKEEVAYWDLHGPDEQRYFNHVCLFYGANPDERDDLAQELGLPEERAEYCPDEYAQAADSWGMIFDEMEDQKSGVPMVFVPGSGAEASFANQLLSEEVKNLNAEMKLPQEVTVKVEACDEANAFYDPQDISIVYCVEFTDHMKEIYQKSGLAQE